jgi:hypothetical protein
LQFRRGAGVVDDFDQELPPALLHQFWFRRPAGHLHPHFWIDRNAKETMLVQNRLHRFSRAFGVGVLHGGVDRLFLVGTEGRAQIIRGLDQPVHLRSQRLPFHVLLDG